MNLYIKRARIMVEDINKSKPIENNIWMTTENGAHYITTKKLLLL